MTTELAFTLLGSAGFLTGLGALLHFLNTRKGTKAKTSADAYSAYSSWVNGAMGQTTAELRKSHGVRAKLIDLVQDLIRFARSKGATTAELDHFQDRLDDLRQL
ncbi:hypothetical protein SEA_YAGO84_17 [Gordonia phage Yago84]|nr:hypothetical protein SEA_YAGO84_17 [Gordonia phage Yago84]QIG58944.1 membrane protein [Gordonia phage AnClar]WIC89999.1 membrane protein [Gordonia phage Sisko]